MGIGHAWIDAQSFLVGLDGHVELALAAINQTQVVKPLDTRAVQLQAAPESLDRLLELLHQVQDGPKVDVRTGPQGIEPGDFAEMVGGAGQLAQLEIDGGQAVMDVGEVGFQAEGLQIDLLRLLPVAGLEGLPGTLAEFFNLVQRGHEGISAGAIA